jgi:hypothetical protein
MQKNIQQHTFGVFISIPLEINADTITTLTEVPVKINLNHKALNSIIERSSAVPSDEVIVDLINKVVRFKAKETDFVQTGTWMYQVFFEHSSFRLPSARGEIVVTPSNQRQI